MTELFYSEKFDDSFYVFLSLPLPSPLITCIFSFFLSAGCSQQRCLVSHACGQPRSCSCLCADGNRGPTQESWRRKKEVGTWITCFLTVLYFFPSFFKLSFHQIFFEMPLSPEEDKHFRKWMAVSKFNASSFVKCQCRLATGQCSLPMKERLGGPTDPCWVLKEVGG